MKREPTSTYWKNAIKETLHHIYLNGLVWKKWKNTTWIFSQSLIRLGVVWDYTEARQTYLAESKKNISKLQVHRRFRLEVWKQFKVINAAVDLTKCYELNKISCPKIWRENCGLFLSELDNFMCRCPTLFLVNIGARVNTT